MPVILVDLDQDQGRLLGLALNRISGDWDEPLLARLLADLSAKAGLDLSLAGFGDDELKALLRSLDRRARRHQPEDFDAVSARANAQAAPPPVRPGDSWQLGDHRLVCGDSTDAATVAQLLDGERAAMAFTDPPYNVALGHHGGAAKRHRPIANDDLEDAAWSAFVRAWAALLLAHVDGALYVCMSTKEWGSLSHLLTTLGAHWSDTIVWAKDHFVLGRADYQRAYEPIWYGWREGAHHSWLGGRDQSDVWTIPRPNDSPLHPTMKPLALIERAIEHSSHPGDALLDLFLGSGSTLIACERTGRRCLGLELDPAYCSIAIARWEAFSGASATLLARHPTEGER